MSLLKIVLSENDSVKDAAVGERLGQFMYYEQGTEASLIQFTLKCLNFPLGTIVGFYCSEPGPVPMIELMPTAVMTYPSFAIGLECFVPANFKGTIYYYAEFKQPPPANVKFQLQAAYPIGE